MRTKYRYSKGILFVMVMFSFGQMYAQENVASPQTLEGCISYALKNHESLKNAQLELEKSESKVKETRSVGLPQLNAKWDITRNIDVMQQFIPGAFPPIPGVEPAEVSAVAFAVDYGSDINFLLTQLLFDGSYFIGLKAAKTYTGLFEKSITSAEIDVVANVSKAYYGVLIAQERVKQLKRNLGQLDQLMNDTQVMEETGLVESIDLKRIAVSINNLKVEIQKVESLEKLSLSLLKFQMGMNESEKITLSGNLDDFVNQLVEETAAVDYNNRIEYKQLNVQETLNDLNIKNEKARALPSLSAFYTFGFNTGSNDFGDVFRFNGGVVGYKPYNMVGASLNIPIWSSGRRKFRIDQAKVDQEILLNERSMLERSIDLAVVQNTMNYNDNLATLSTHKDNVALAEEVYRVSKIKYEEGLGSNFEVVEAENALKDAQTNYYGAVYEALVNKIELEKAKGTLIK